MNIKKHGEYSSKNKDIEEFKCENCGCEFTADYDEYFVSKGSQFSSFGSLSYTYSVNVTDTYVCSCPECHRIVVKTKQRLVENPTITLTSTSPESVPDTCKSCLNHPSNGGSGNCNCSLGDKITCTAEG